jgi:hypothetical protein
MRKGLLIFILMMVQTVILTACNLPTGNPTGTETDLPDLVFTKAAETLEAIISPTVQDTPFRSTATLTPSVEAQTPTMEPTTSSTPTETPIPSEIPDVIFTDDFSDTSGWYTNEDDRFGFYYTEDGYHIYNSIRMGVIWSIRDFVYSGLAIEVDGTRLEGSEESYFGVVCKFSDDGENYYALVIGDNGFFGLGLMEAGEYEFIETGIDETGAIKDGIGETNRIRGVCNGNHFLI